ncbi:MAG: hypothetical protein IT204_19090 [Fimbriimonadaceae bacterium]|nr:hypothetical protein [Fimbriimonadaceae bacterium]
MKPSGSRAPLLAAFGTGLCLTWLVVYAGTGRLSDDGLHAYAARMLVHGHQLYRDFEYHQAPLFPYVLAAWFRVVGVGMDQARLLAALLAAATLWQMLRLARRLGASPAAEGWLLLAAALSPSLVLHLGYVQSQGLATLLGLLAVRAALEPGRRAVLAAWALAALAAGARVSFVVLLLPLAVHTWRTARWQVLLGATVWLATLAVVFGPHLRHGLADMLYLPFGQGQGNLVTAAYTALYARPSGFTAGLLGRLGGWPNQLQYYAPLWLLLLASWRSARGLAASHRPELRLLLSTALLLTFVHGVLPRRINHSYLVVVMPLWAALAAAWLRTERLGWLTRRLTIVLLVLVSAPALLRGIGRIDLSNRKTVSRELQMVGQALRGQLQPGEEVFTFAVEFAVEADVDVTPGCESGYFSYYPNLSTRDARRARVLNPPLVRQILRQRRPALVLLHDGAFGPLETSPVTWPDAGEFRELLVAGYRPVDFWREVGERRQDCALWRRNTER